MGKVVVEILSARTMLVPRELFDAENAKAMLAANGMRPSSEECVVWSDAEQEIVAVMTVCEEAAKTASRKLGDRVAYTTPLLYTPETTAPTVWCYRVGDLLYIKVYGDTLRFAEVVPAPAETDVLYFFERLGGVFALKDFELQVEGANARALKKRIKKRFK